MYNSSCASETSRPNKQRNVHIFNAKKNSKQPDHKIHPACKSVAFRTSHECHKTFSKKTTSLENSRARCPKFSKTKPSLSSHQVLLSRQIKCACKSNNISNRAKPEKETKQMISMYADQPTVSTIRRCPTLSSYHPAPWSWPQLWPSV